MTQNIIFLVVGVSGIGKTTLCRYLTEVEDVNHFSASDFVDDGISSDQANLSRQIRKAVNQLTKPTILDGHLVVAGSKISLEAISALAPKAIIVVTGNPSKIVSQRITESIKIRPKETECEIDKAQGEEISWAREIAHAEGIEFLTIEALDKNGFREQVRKILGL